MDSGDLGYKDEDGYLCPQGRKGFMVKSKGVKVFPGPIEKRRNDHPDVDEVAVIGLDDEEYGQKVTAVVKPSDHGMTGEDLNERYLDADSIARFERPRTYVFTNSEIPRTPSNKLHRNRLNRKLENDEIGE